MNTALDVLHTLRDTLADRAMAHLRSGGGDEIEVGPIDVPGIGPVELRASPHPQLPGLGARAVARPSVPLGRLLRPGSPLADDAAVLFARHTG